MGNARPTYTGGTMKPLIATLLAVFLAVIAFGQSTENLPAFETADVHVSPKSVNQNMRGGSMPGDRFELRNATMLDLIVTAYGVPAEKVLGGPSWLELDRFDVIAKAPRNSSDDTTKMMLRALLADRFKLVFHNEDKPITAYVLTAPKRGAQLKQTDGSPTNCQGVPQNPTPGEIPYQVVSCHNMTMAQLADRLRQMASAYIDNPVIDATDLQGSWDFTIKFTGRGNLAAAGAAGITPFDALDKQLGLKLELQKRPSPVMVVDRVNQKPADNPPDVVQKLPARPTEFEVAEIKTSPAGVTTQSGGFQPGGRIDVRGFTMKNLIMVAWDVPEIMLAGQPKWFETERYDIVAKAPASVSVSGAPIDIDALRGMLRNLVIDRFKLKTHTEDQPVQVYALLSPKRENKLKKADPSSRSSCKMSIAAPTASAATMRVYVCQNTTMAQLAEKLQGSAGGYIDRPIVDVTGLEGGWDFTFTFSPRNVFDAATNAPNGSLSLFEAIDKQLGLKLEMQKHPVPVLVIDQVEQKPTEN